MNDISFMSANFVARELDYSMHGGWAEGESAANSFFEPMETFRERFSDLLTDVKSLGFHKMDLWTAHLNWKWATDVHIAIVKSLLEKHEMTLASYAGGFGETAEEFERACRTARATGIELLGGSAGFLARDRAAFSALLKKHSLKFAYENHPEKSSDEILDHISGTDEELVGVCVDTGWLGTNGYDAARALREVRDRLFYVHLKDVTAPGAHATCALGAGCVPIRNCVETLREIKYLGGISVEHEPEDRNPAEEIRTSRALLEDLLA